MVNLLQVFTIILAGISVAVADVFIKKIAVSGGFWLIMKSPWMIAILLLYFAQIVFFAYVFTHEWNLGIVGNLQMAFYSITVVLSGILLFGEKISPVQGIGILLTLIGVILMNI